MSEIIEEKIPPLKKWVVAARPWSFPASTMPVIFGTSLAVVFGGANLDLFRFFLAFAAMIILHSGANILSDIFDFRRGLDKTVTPVSGAIVRSWISIKQGAVASFLLFSLGSAIGIVLVWITGWTLLIIGVVGVAIGIFYFFLKPHALGDLAVFLDFGILGALGAWVVQTKDFSWIPVVWTVPMAGLVSAILHANNWRDSVSDREKKVTTIASLLGDKGSLAYYGLLVFTPFLYDSMLIAVPRLAKSGGEGLPALAMPPEFLLIFLALPSAVSLWKKAMRRHNPRRPMDFVILDGATANHNLIFGGLSVAAVWLHYILQWL